MMFKLSTILLILPAFCQGSHGDLEQILHHYDTLHQSDISVHHHVTKRRTENNLLYHNKIISFDTLGRSFKLHLSTCRHLFTNDFKATAIEPGADGAVHEDIPLDIDQFYEGFIDNDTDSRVSAYWEEGNLVAKIRTRDDIYIVEPSWRHLPRSKKHSMLSYRASDIKVSPNSPSFCGYLKAGVNTSIDLHNPVADDNMAEDSFKRKNKTQNGRYKRQTTSNQVCQVALVADYRFAKNVGDGSKSITAKYLVGILAAITSIYETTNFGHGYYGVGLEIKGIVIYTEPSPSPEFNRDQVSWATQPFLESFGKENWGDYCLAHLFTYQKFAGGVLGLGWVASPASNEVGGICSPVYGGKYYNAAWTSHQSSGGSRLLAQQADLVTAHEFGHNWGSPHDTSNCAPSVQNGGKHLMYQYAVSGYDPNNDAFSSCSRSSIGSVLKSKAPGCFKARAASYCGNFNVEDGEVCDAGTVGLQGLDACCTSQCQLIKGLQCSDANDVCCSNCQFKSSGVECRAISRATCEAAATCTGSSGTCPLSSPLAEGSNCNDRGTCTASGQCQPLCESNSLISCSCDQEATACKYCCKSSASGSCSPYTGGGGPFDLPEGRSCYAGYCEVGACVPSDADQTARLWDVIKDFDINAILKWMKNNIILTTIVLSLVIYLPLCLVVFCIDRRNAKKEEKEREWLDKDNDKLVMEGHDKEIRRATPRRRNQPGGAYSSLNDTPSHTSVSNVDYHPRHL